MCDRAISLSFIFSTGASRFNVFFAKHDIRAPENESVHSTTRMSEVIIKGWRGGTGVVKDWAGWWSCDRGMELPTAY